MRERRDAWSLDLRAQSRDQQLRLREVADPPRVIDQQMVTHSFLQPGIAALQDNLPDPLLPERHVRVLRPRVHQREEHPARHLRLDLGARKTRLHGENVLHLREPALQRLEVAPFKCNAVDQRAPGEAAAREFGARLEAPVGPLEMRSRSQRVEWEPAHAAPVVEPWIALVRVGGKIRQPPLEDLAAPLLDQDPRVRDDQTRQPIYVLGGVQQLGGPLRLPIGFV